MFAEGRVPIALSASSLREFKYPAGNIDKHGFDHQPMFVTLLLLFDIYALNFYFGTLCLM
jgi:hypothetical protein